MHDGGGEARGKRASGSDRYVSRVTHLVTFKIEIE